MYASGSFGALTRNGSSSSLISQQQQNPSGYTVGSNRIVSWSSGGYVGGTSTPPRSGGGGTSSSASSTPPLVRRPPVAASSSPPINPRRQQQASRPPLKTTQSQSALQTPPTITVDADRDGQPEATASKSSSATIPRLVVEDADISPSNCFRLVLLGSARVGKTSLVARFLGSRFNDAYTPTIEDFHRKFYRIRGETYRLDILDTSGNDPFPAMRRLSLLTGDLFLVVYSIDSRESFDEARRLQEQVYLAKGGHGGAGGQSAAGTCSTGPGGVISRPLSVVRSKPSSHVPHVPMVIVGNKSDREAERVVDAAELDALAKAFPGSCGGVETSAKRNVNVDEVFVKLFMLARLPTEMSPSQHRKVQPSTYLGVPTSGDGPPSPSGTSGTYLGASGGCGSGPGASPMSIRRRMVSLRRRLSDACGAVAINARRPSIRTDLLALQQSRRTLGAGGDGSSADGGSGSLAGDLARGGRDVAAKCCVS